MRRPPRKSSSWLIKGSARGATSGWRLPVPHSRWRRQAERRGIAIKLAVTSNGAEVVDPARLEPRRSATCWRRATCRRIRPTRSSGCGAFPSASRRDVILLTHPRSLVRPEVDGGGAGAGRGGGGPAVRDLG